ncbi:MAG: flavin monoamine oxidase family protein [Actinomycetota bacterium]
MDADVIVIGAGLAGLRSARRLEAGGRSVVVLEAEDAVGGRIRTDVVDGFRCDRGFQLLNPAYPAVQRWIDVDALRLQRFGVGAVVRTGDRAVTLAHPLRHPRHLLATAASELTPASDLFALARWLGPTLLRASTASRATSDETLRASFDAAGLTGRLRRDVLDTFLAGVLVESTGESSANYVRLLLRSFALGAPGLPRQGMQALPEQLAASLREPVRLRTAARDIREAGGGVHVTTDAGTIRAKAAIVAVGPQHVAELSPLAAPETHGLTTWWFRATGQPRTGPFLLLDASRPSGGPAGPIWNAAVISEVAPSYAPSGQHLVQATTLLDRPDGRASEAEVRRDLARLFGTSTRRWEVLAHHVVPQAVPAQRPGPIQRGPIWTSERVLVTGDHRETASIQGALVAGDRAGRAAERRLSERS